MRSKTLKGKIKTGSYISKLEKKVKRLEEELYVKERYNRSLRMKLMNIKKVIK